MGLIHRYVFIGITLFFSEQEILSQVRLFESKEIMDQIRNGIDHVYNYDFQGADSIFRQVEKLTPGHPVNPFLRGFLIYWEATPLTPFEERSGEFVVEMEETKRICQAMTDRNEEDIEGIFFDLAAHALLLLYYADNGDSRSVLSLVIPAYRLLRQGFYLDQKFAEFRFFTGVYNYYREVYPVIHPVYKPVSVFFPPGDKDVGWKMLLWIMDNSVFLRAEALYFLSHIAMSMQDNPELSLTFTEEVLAIFPHNNFFRIRHMLALNSAGKYTEMKYHIKILQQEVNRDRFSSMACLIFGGIVLEKQEKNDKAAEQCYLEGLKITEQYGTRVDNYSALAHFGLSRIYERTGDKKEARNHWKEAKSQAKYDYILKNQ
jgi:tetratricopeptide (TPR) repeat protein